MSADQVKSTLSKHVEKSRQDGWLFDVLSRKIASGRGDGGAKWLKNKNLKSNAAQEETSATNSTAVSSSFSTDPVPNLLRLPILLSGLQKVIDNEPVAYGRYYSVNCI